MENCSLDVRCPVEAVSHRVRAASWNDSHPQMRRRDSGIGIIVVDVAVLGRSQDEAIEDLRKGAISPDTRDTVNVVEGTTEQNVSRVVLSLRHYHIRFHARY